MGSTTIGGNMCILLFNNHIYVEVTYASLKMVLLSLVNSHFTMGNYELAQRHNVLAAYLRQEAPYSSTQKRLPVPGSYFDGYLDH